MQDTCSLVVFLLDDRPETMFKFHKVCVYVSLRLRTFGESCWPEITGTEVEVSGCIRHSFVGFFESINSNPFLEALHLPLSLNSIKLPICRYASNRQRMAVCSSQRLLFHRLAWCMCMCVWVYGCMCGCMNLRMCVCVCVQGRGGVLCSDAQATPSGAVAGWLHSAGQGSHAGRLCAAVGPASMYLDACGIKTSPVLIGWPEPWHGLRYTVCRLRPRHVILLTLMPSPALLMHGAKGSIIRACHISCCPLSKRSSCFASSTTLLWVYTCTRLHSYLRPLALPSLSPLHSTTC